MKKAKIFFYPFFVFFIIFSIDKLAYFENIRKYGRTGNTGLENIRDGMDLIWEKRLLESRNVLHPSDNRDRPRSPLTEQSQKNQTEEKQVIVIFGTSRSERLKFNHPKNVESSSFLSRADKRIIGGLDLETRLTDRGSEFMYNLFLLNAMFESGYKPDLVLFELSPEMFNENSYAGFHYQWSSNIFPLEFIREIFPLVSNDWKKKMLYSLLFPSSYYKFQPIKALLNAMKGEDYKTHNETYPILQHFPTLQAISQNYDDVPVHTNSGELYEERILGYSRQMFESYFYRDYEFSETERNLFVKILKIAQKSEVPFLFWRPRLHPQYNQMIEKRIPESADDIFQEYTEKYNQPFYNAQKDSFQCDSYSDSSHLSSRCSPELLIKLWKKSPLYPEN